MKLITKSEAATQGLTHYYTGKPCLRGHDSVRFVSTGQCRACGAMHAMSKFVPKTDRKQTKWTTATWVTAMTELHKGTYTYENVVFVAAKKSVNVTCPHHGDFPIRPDNHRSGKGCPLCGTQRMANAQRNTAKVFARNAERVWGDRWDYSQTTYGGANDRVHIVCPQHGEFTQRATNHLSGRIGCSKCGHMASTGEDAVAAFCGIFAPVNSRDRVCIAPMELDVVVPSRGVAIEYCGMYWHSAFTPEAEVKLRGKHALKHAAARAAGLRLVTVYESEWLNRNAQVRRLLRGAMGKLKGKLAARDCLVREIPHAEAGAFFDKYHIQGAGGNGVNYGLLYKGKLVACMKFNYAATERGAARSTATWNLSRYASRLPVMGGATKLFTAFLRAHPQAAVKSFSDNRYFTGDMYAKLGFTLDAELPPDYAVWSPKIGLRSKSNYQRRELQQRLRDHGSSELYDHTVDTRTEWDMTQLMKCGRIYDCGKKRWLYQPLH